MTAQHAPLVLDAGAGTGHHLATVLDALPKARGVAFDASRAALRQAARSHQRIAAIAGVSGTTFRCVTRPPVWS